MKCESFLIFFLILILFNLEQFLFEQIRESIFELWRVNTFFEIFCFQIIGTEIPLQPIKSTQKHFKIDFISSLLKLIVIWSEKIISVNEVDSKSAISYEASKLSVCKVDFLKLIIIIYCTDLFNKSC